MDIFCLIKEKLADQIIYQTKNFYVVHDGYPLLEGHLLIIPKQHIDCYLNLNPVLIQEFNLIKNKMIRFLTKYYCRPVIFEHGVAGQTVLHAHLHLLPTNKTIIKDLTRVGRIVKRPTIPYLYFEYKNKKIYYTPKNEIEPGLIHSIIYANLLNRPKNAIERKKTLNKWLFKVKLNFKNGC